MTPLTMHQFDAFFNELYGQAPYPWQKRLAEQAIQGIWPGAIDLPTGSGKTACIDIAIFALACQAALPVKQRTAPRRLFFCVNRRVIVDEAHRRALSIAESLWKAEQGLLEDRPILCRIAEALRTVGGTTSTQSVPPLDVIELRGGVYRDNRWARSVTQSTVVCTTLDQLGSRLLFRGYGVSPNAAPIQAALIAYDSLILLDEAHISEPFRQTLEFVQRYLNAEKWAEQALGIPRVQVVPMTATPNEAMRERGVIQLEDEDRASQALHNRLSAPKPAELRVTKKVVADIVKSAQVLSTDGPAAVGVIVNRIATAREIYEKLCELQQEPNEKKRKIPADAPIELVIGSMRPIDRDVQAESLRILVGPDRPPITTETSIVVATQCLEVGADYDFDILLTECASLDALRQRFGRLNRGGRKQTNGNFVDAQAIVFIDEKSVATEAAIEKAENSKDAGKRLLDPIYGNALARTWNWLWEHASTFEAEDGYGHSCGHRYIDFGNDAFQQLLKEHGEKGRVPPRLLPPSALLPAPVMLPAYVDMWCQTAPRPVPDPDVSLFIHGLRGGEPDVQVCWRADLVEDGHMTYMQWCDVIALLPPTAAECVSLPISRLGRWIADSPGATDHGDTLGTASEDTDEQTKGSRPSQSPLRCHGVLWRGANERTKLIESPRDLQPGDTLVLPASVGEARTLAHISATDARLSHPTEESSNDLDSAIRDVAETTFTHARDRAVIRLHPALQPNFPPDETIADLFAAAARRIEVPTLGEWSALLNAAAKGSTDTACGQHQALSALSKSAIRVDAYPDGRGVVITTRRRLKTSMSWFIRAIDEGDDHSSRTQRDYPVPLEDHTEHVHTAVSGALAQLPLQLPTELFTQAADLHDWGKADDRFQAMLLQASRSDAWLYQGRSGQILAKSKPPDTRLKYKLTCQRAGLPEGYRHEMLSVQLAEVSGLLPENSDAQALILHLIASHHGHARPFAPVVIDDELPSVECNGIRLTHEQRAALVSLHRLDSGVPERFWSLTCRFGWWGLAYLEAVLRLSDQQATAAEDAGHDNEYVAGLTEELPA